MKHIKIIIAIIASSLILCACSVHESEQDNYFGFNPDEFTVVTEEDTHGGFHGDGSFNLVLDCSDNEEQAREIIKDWNQLPLTENLGHAMYGIFAKDADWPKINNGVYKFVDRHSESVNESDDTELLDRSSSNFSIAVYDLDTNILYYYEIDT